MMLKTIRGRQIFCSKYFIDQLVLARNRNVLSKENSVVYGSNIQWHGRSEATSIPSESPKARRGQEKVSKDERRTMLECFVNNYRATHNGKFPTVTEAKKEVGGGFYVIRSILQELEYKSKVSSSDRGSEKFLGVGIIKKNKVTVDVESQNELHTIVDEDVEVVDINDKQLEAEGGPSASFLTGRTSFEEVTKSAFHGARSGREDGKKEAVGVSSYFVASEGHILKRETEEISHPHLMNADEKGQILSDKLLDPGDVKCKEKPYKDSSEPEQNAADNSSSKAEDKEVPKKSTIWGSLKSIADSFINMWKRL